MVVKLYIYDKATGAYLYTDTGNPNDVIRDLGDDKDFTTLAVPDGNYWHWQDKAWVQKDPNAVNSQ